MRRALGYNRMRIDAGQCSGGLKVRASPEIWRSTQHGNGVSWSLPLIAPREPAAQNSVSVDIASDIIWIIYVHCQPAEALTRTPTQADRAVQEK
jgi:hypothetical protein